jgi:hypothetical protein
MEEQFLDIFDDSSMETLAYSIADYLELSKIKPRKKRRELVQNFLNNKLPEFDVDYEDLMQRCKKDIGPLLYDLERSGIRISVLDISFMGYRARESFEILMDFYMHIHDKELSKPAPRYPVVFNGSITVSVPAQTGAEAINSARIKMEEILKEQFGKDTYSNFLYIRSRE